MLCRVGLAEHPPFLSVCQEELAAQSRSHSQHIGFLIHDEGSEEKANWRSASAAARWSAATRRTVRQLAVERRRGDSGLVQVYEEISEAVGRQSQPRQSAHTPRSSPRTSVTFAMPFSCHVAERFVCGRSRRAHCARATDHDELHLRLDERDQPVRRHVFSSAMPAAVS